MSSAITITVFGSGRVDPGSPQYQQAHQLGSAIAQEGWTLCNGGYGGTMQAAAQGAKQAGGRVIGITCTIFAPTDNSNPYLDEEVATPNLLARLSELVRRGDGYVVLPGGTGTLLELACVWELTNKHLAERKPIILLGDYWQPVLATCAREDPAVSGLVHQASNVEAAIAYLRSQFTSY